MNEENIVKQLEEIRESIRHGRIEGLGERLSDMMNVSVPRQLQNEILQELMYLSLLGGDIKESRMYLDEVKKAFKKQEAARIRAFSAHVSFLGGRRKKALSIFETCIEEEPNNYEYYLLRGMSYLEVNDLDYALADFSRARMLCPDNVVIDAMLAEYEMRLGNTARAIELNESVLEVNPTFRRCLINLSLLYMDESRLNEAYGLLEALLAKEPFNWFAWTCLGDIFMMTPGKFFQALPAYSAALICGNNIAQTHLYLAQGLTILGRYRQAVGILEKAREQKCRFDTQETVSCTFLELILETITKPQFERSKAFDDRFFSMHLPGSGVQRLLFHVLSVLCSFDYSDDILTIFSAHMTSFCFLGEFIHHSQNRLIEQDEALLLGIIAHFLIWNGMLYEARTILAMMPSEAVPRITDMHQYLINEIVQFCEFSARAEIDLCSFHEYLIGSQKALDDFKYVMDGRTDDIPYMHMIEYRSILKRFLVALTPEIGGLLMRTPLDQVLDDVVTKCGEDIFFNGNYYAMLSKLWSACAAVSRNAHGVGNVTENEAVLRVAEDYFKPYQISIAKPLQALYASASSDEKNGGIFLQDQQFFDLVSLIVVNSRGNSDVANDIIKSLCDGFQAANCDIYEEPPIDLNDPDGLLLPFVMDCSVFRKAIHLSDIKMVHKKSVESIFRQMAEWQTFVYRRGACTGVVDTRKDESFEKVYERMKSIWQMLHGRLPMRADWLNFHSGDDVTAQAMAMIGMCSGWHGTAYLASDSAFGKCMANNWLLPRSPRYATQFLYTRQEAPEFPKSARIFNRVVTAGLLSKADLEEQFFNRAILAVKNWMKSGDEEEFNFLFDDDICHILSLKELRHLLKTSGRVSKSKNEDCDTILNTVTPEAAKDIQKCVITPKMIAESLERAYAEYLTSNKNYRGIFIDGIQFHPYFDQFRLWANAHAEALYMEIHGIEAQLLSKSEVKSGNILLKIRELLNRYPYLSRLYLLLAAYHQNRGDMDKAMTALKTGMEWEKKLYTDGTWDKFTNGAESDVVLEPVMASTEYYGEEMLIWEEQYVYNRDPEAVYHFIPNTKIMNMHAHTDVAQTNGIPFVMSVVHNHKGGAYEFYHLFENFIKQMPLFEKIYLEAVAKHGVYSFKDYLKYFILSLGDTGHYTLRRQMAELLFELYPQEKSGVLGRYYGENMHYGNALPYASYALFSIDPEKWHEQDGLEQASLTLGCLFYDMGYMDEAVTFLEKATENAHPAAMAYLSLGCACIETKAFDRAIACLKKGLTCNAMKDRFYYNLALAYFEIGDDVESEKCVKAGLLTAQYPVDLKIQLLRIYVYRKDHSQALALARNIIDEDPAMFASALAYPEFETFRNLSAVQNLLRENGIEI